MNRGERATTRTKSVIKQSLSELFHEKNYPDITVSDITKRANIGRSTFYRHYKSKAEVMVDFHKDMFSKLFSGLSIEELCHRPEPPKELVDFFITYQLLGRNHFSLIYKLGNDLDYLITNINLALTTTVKEWLQKSYREKKNCIPLTILAQSIAASYSGLLMSWFSTYQSIDAKRFAIYIHRLICSMVREAGLKSKNNPLTYR